MEGEPAAWVSMIGEAEARRLMPSDYTYGESFIPAFFRLIQSHPRIAEAFWPLQAAVLQGDPDSPLSIRDRELVALVAAVAQDCTHCVASHAQFLRATGCEEELVRAIGERRWRRHTSLSARDAALCAVAEKISAEATRMTEQDWRPLRELGLDDRACMEVAHIVGFMNYATRLADGLGLVDPAVLPSGAAEAPRGVAWGASVASGGER